MRGSFCAMLATLLLAGCISGPHDACRASHVGHVRVELPEVGLVDLPVNGISSGPSFGAGVAQFCECARICLEQQAVPFHGSSGSPMYGSSGEFLGASCRHLDPGGLPRAFGFTKADDISRWVECVRQRDTVRQLAIFDREERVRVAPGSEVALATLWGDVDCGVVVAMTGEFDGLAVFVGHGLNEASGEYHRAVLRARPMTVGRNWNGALLVMAEWGELVGATAFDSPAGSIGAVGARPPCFTLRIRIIGATRRTVERRVHVVLNRSLDEELELICAAIGEWSDGYVPERVAVPSVGRPGVEPYSSDEELVSHTIRNLLHSAKSGEEHVIEIWLGQKQSVY